MRRYPGGQLIAFQGVLPPEGKGADFGRNEVVNIYLRTTHTGPEACRLEWSWKWSLRHFRRGGSTCMGGTPFGSTKMGNVLANEVRLTGAGSTVDFFVHRAPTSMEFGTIYMPSVNQALVDTARFLKGIDESALRQEASIKSMEVSSRRLGKLTLALVILTAVLATTTVVSILLVLGVR